MTIWRDRMLFVSNVGSHLWGMNRPDSDLDLFVCYQEPSKDILLGKRPASQHVQTIESGQKMDRAVHELGHVVDQILKGNVNFLWGVFSPNALGVGTFPLYDFRDRAKSNLSRQVYRSIHGLAFQNYNKYIVSGKDVSEKRCNIIARTVEFGISLLREGVLLFSPVSGTRPDDIPYLIERLDAAHRQSILPPLPPAPHLLTDFLLEQRLKDLEGTD